MGVPGVLNVSLTWSGVPSLSRSRKVLRKCRRDTHRVTKLNSEHEAWRNSKEFFKKEKLVHFDQGKESLCFFILNYRIHSLTSGNLRVEI